MISYLAKKFFLCIILVFFNNHCKLFKNLKYEYL